LTKSDKKKRKKRDSKGGRGQLCTERREKKTSLTDKQNTPGKGGHKGQKSGTDFLWLTHDKGDDNRKEG